MQLSTFVNVRTTQSLHTSHNWGFHCFMTIVTDTTMLFNSAFLADCAVNEKIVCGPKLNPICDVYSLELSEIDNMKQKNISSRKQSAQWEMGALKAPFGLQKIHVLRDMETRTQSLWTFLIPLHKETLPQSDKNCYFECKCGLPIAGATFHRKQNQILFLASVIVDKIQKIFNRTDWWSHILLLSFQFSF